MLNGNIMNFSSQGKQLQIDVFRSSLDGLNKSNRLVELGDTLPWDEIEQLYNKRLNNGKRGTGNKPARMIIGALVIKHKMNFSDEDTILAIQENPYMQYFVGLSEFTDKPIFDSSLFVSIRKRLSTADFNDMSVSLLTLQVEKARAASKATPEDKDQSTNDSGASSSNNAFTDSQGRYHEGALKIDATCADAEVRYTTEIELYWQRFGFLPAKIYADKIYLNKTNRKLMKEMEIQAMGKPLGRPSKESRTEEYQAQLVNAVGQRNEIEATFGTGKRIYRANNIRAKLPETANCWTGMCYFVKNVMKFLRELLHALIFVINLLANHASIWRKVTPLPRFAYCGVLND